MPMPYTVHSDRDRRHMLEVINASGMDQLFAQIPGDLREAVLRLPPAIDEQELRARAEALAAANLPAGGRSFLGAGCSRHFVPAAVRALVSRSEFATAYTPYQPEVSQGTLEHIFEFQTCICELTGMDVANASLYDGASALAEAAFMALRVTQRIAMVVSAGVHPEAQQVVSTYASGPLLPIHHLPLDPRTGTTIGALPACDVGAVLVQQPNYLGVIEDIESLAATAHASGALLAVSVNPAVLGLLESPGALGADIVVGDAQVFGCPPSFGGPSVGFLGCREEYLRQIPGRLVSQTTDQDGRACYALTLQAREQHIRRARATSNICFNQALSALAATIHLSLLGPAGLRERGEICLHRAHRLYSRLCALPGVTPLVVGPFFHEFALSLPCSADEFASAMRARGIDPGVPLTRLWQGFDRGLNEGGNPRTPGLTPTGGPVDAANVLLVAVTELNPPEALEAYVTAAVDVLATPAALRFVDRAADRRAGDPWPPFTGRRRRMSRTLPDPREPPEPDPPVKPDPPVEPGPPVDLLGPIFARSMPGHRGMELPAPGVPTAGWRSCSPECGYAGCLLGCPKWPKPRWCAITPASRTSIIASIPASIPSDRAP
jgi:glycine dehydrogenase subunit 1